MSFRSTLLSSLRNGQESVQPKESDSSSKKVINTPTDKDEYKAPKLNTKDMEEKVEKKPVNKPVYQNGPNSYKNGSVRSTQNKTTYQNSARRDKTETLVSDKVRSMIEEEEKIDISDKKMDVEIPVVTMQELESPVNKTNTESIKFIEPSDQMSGRMYAYFEIRNLVNLLTTKDELESYTKEELTLLKNQMAPVAFLEQRVGPHSMKLWYYQVHALENIARAFVQRYSTSDSRLMSVNISNSWLLGTQLTIVLQYKNGVVEQFTDVGAASISKAYDSEKDFKSASSDAFKRAFRHFGNLFGMALYDKSYTSWLNTMVEFHSQTEVSSFRTVRHAILLNVYMLLLHTPDAIEAAFNHVKPAGKKLTTNDMINNTSIQELAGKILDILERGGIPGRILSREEIAAIRQRIESRRTGDPEKKIIE